MVGGKLRACPTKNVKYQCTQVGINQILAVLPGTIKGSVWEQLIRTESMSNAAKLCFEKVIYVTEGKVHTGSVRKRLFLNINKIFRHAKVTRSFFPRNVMLLTQLH